MANEVLLNTVPDAAKKWKKFVAYYESNKNFVFNKGNGKEQEDIDKLLDYAKNKNFDATTESKEILFTIGLKKWFDYHRGNKPGGNELLEFSRLCTDYLFTDKEVFKAFQIELRRIKTIRQLYEDNIGKLPDFSEFEKIHKKTNGKSIYELFGFEPEDEELDTLKDISNKEPYFTKSVYSRKGKFEIFSLFANVFIDTQTKENYDEYYRFLKCRTILEGIQGDNKPVIDKRYRNAEEAIINLKLKSIKDDFQVKNLIVAFCVEIGLRCEPKTEDEFKKTYEKRKEEIRLKIEELVSKLIEDKNQGERNLDADKDKLNKFLSLIDSSLNDIETRKNKIENSTNPIYEEQSKKQELNKIFSEIEILKQKIEGLVRLCSDTKKFIENNVDDAKKIHNNINEDIIEKQLDDIETIQNEITKKHREFNTKYSTEYIKNGQDLLGDLTGCWSKDKLSGKFYKKEKEIYDARETKDKEISNKIIGLRDEKDKQNKPLTKRFVWIQILLGIVFFAVYMPLYSAQKLELSFFGLNAIGFIIYVVLASIQFNKYNEATKALNKYKNEIYRSKGNLIGNIILACIFFMLLQLSFLIGYYYF